MTVTNVQNFEMVLNELQNLGASAGSIAFIKSRIAHEKTKSEKRKSYRSKNDVLNQNLMTAILNFMEVGKPYRVNELTKEVPELNGYSDHKTNALVTKLKNAGLITRTEEKGNAYFTKN